MAGSGAAPGSAPGATRRPLPSPPTATTIDPIPFEELVLGSDFGGERYFVIAHKNPPSRVISTTTGVGATRSSSGQRQVRR